MSASRARRGGIHDTAEFRQKFKNLVIDRHRYANNLVPVAGLHGVVPWSTVSGTATQKFMICYVHIQRINGI